MHMKEMGSFLQSLRKSKGLTQQELADMLNVSNKTVSKWENGLGIPEMSTLLLLADLYEVSVDDILRGSKKMQKSDDKPIERFTYIISKSKHQYVNHLVLSFGVLIIALISFLVSDELGVKMSVSVMIASSFILGSILIQVFNLVRVHYQLKETNEEELVKTFHRKVFFSSLCLLFCLLWFIIYMIFMNFTWEKSTYGLLYVAIVPALALSLFQTLIIYLLMSLSVKFSFSIKLSKIAKVFSVLFMIILITPFLIVQFYPTRDLAIKLQWSDMSQSIYDIHEQEERYFQIKLLYLIDEGQKQGVMAEDIYEVITVSDGLGSIPMVYYHFTSPIDYELMIEENHLLNFLIPLEYSHYEIDDQYAKAFLFLVSERQLSKELYGYIFGNLISVWGFALCISSIIVKSKKSK